MNDEMSDETPENPAGDDTWHYNTGATRPAEEGLGPRDILLGDLLRETPGDMDPVIADRAIKAALGQAARTETDMAPVKRIASHRPAEAQHDRRTHLIGIAAGVALLVLVSFGALMLRDGSGSANTTAGRAVDSAQSGNSAGIYGTRDGQSSTIPPRDNGSPTTTAATGAGSPETDASNEEGPSGDITDGIAPSESSGAGSGSYGTLPYGGSFDDPASARSTATPETAPTRPTPSEVASCADDLSQRGSTPLRWVLIGDVAAVVATPASGSARAMPGQTSPEQVRTDQPQDPTVPEIFRALTCTLWN